MRIKLDFGTDLNLKMNFEHDGTIKTEFLERIGGASPPYEGDYEVVSDAHEDRFMQTKNHRMIDNVKVKKIPYEEVRNQSGTTVSISS